MVMENTVLINESYDKVIAYMIGSGYAGYDPYDGASSNLKWISKYEYARLISTYVNKFSPVNIRPLLKITHSIQNQAIAFIARAMLHRYEVYSKEINKIAEHLIVDSLIDNYGYHCWDAHGIPIQLRYGFKSVGETDIIGTEAIGRLFYELHILNPDDRYKQICLSIRDLIQNELGVRWDNVHYFRYTPLTKRNRWCYNASIIAALYVVRISKYFDVDYENEFVDNAVRDIISRQKKDGEWYYSTDMKTGFEKEQIDFHQGFILDALLEYMQLNGFNAPFLGSYLKGLNFYKNKQFLPEGQGIYRYPQKYPVNIHNQAQGIITFSKAAAAGFGDHYADFARTIAGWTIKHMQDPDGHFYYLKYPFFTNKIPYIRWSDAAMAYALSVYLKYFEKIYESTSVSRTSGTLSPL